MARHLVHLTCCRGSAAHRAVGTNSDDSRAPLVFWSSSTLPTSSLPTRSIFGPYSHTPVLRIHPRNAVRPQLPHGGSRHALEEVTIPLIPPAQGLASIPESPGSAARRLITPDECSLISPFPRFSAPSPQLTNDRLVRRAIPPSRHCCPPHTGHLRLPMA
ncbi:hypothetical protein N7462_003673 [Penicillium macrosclerotiorum]|uniref:uncharacterized protein n=1 Tax=Penicillium macrosclerotiorum TaxID=303699 RepID=UPI002548D19E|nr:uncharacterized protein N7462_003673 [Penicillium macrosclerotiorum]KAJ5689281.1 hypothetical protein N7462_003673 [Penicillium macrosclerotiorum]